ncbi:MAG: hypothetical protein LQ343_005553 [Gyalolechia ehrenbergii]|nr:MAG: hypothetical protein LQ343_005553 [Gyalolechia ehrenbergii]
MHRSDSSDLEHESSRTLQPSILEENQDLIMSSDNDTVHAPPAHLAARFYKSSSYRRKTSAASSRRNSLSSHHSSKSSRSAHGGPQSTHIAQHLRRASIIESRKARLADRAAHAEQVRLRAAMAKAAPRFSTTSEERALAAKNAREKFLAQVAANCAEEVKRAKRVAEDTREKKAAEHLKLKEDMQERLAEAERRRSVLQQNQRRPRTATLPSVEEKKVILRTWRPRNDAEAAKIIQRAWQNRRRRLIVSDFLGLGLTLESIQRTSFEEVGELLNQDQVLDTTAKLLRFYGLQEEGADSIGEKVTVRTFLSAFLVLGHPAQVLTEDGEQEKDLIEKAKGLFLSFDPIITCPSSAPSTQQLESLSEAYTGFQTAFTAWKDRDSSILLGTLLAQFVELDAIWQSVKDDKDGHVAADYKEGVQHNQTLLLVRLKRLAGADRAMKMIREAVRKSRKASAKKKPLGDVRPRATSLPSADAIAPSLTPIEASVSDTAATNPAHRKATPLLPDNRTIMHELAINKEYRIDVKPKTDTRENVIREVSETMRQGLESDFGDMFVVAMAETIREKLLSLVVPGKSLHTLISESLDTTMIANQLKLGAFSYQQFFSFMNSLLPKICAPVRDTDVKALAEDKTDDPIERLARLNYVIDLLSIDHANFSLQMNAPLLIKEATSYEQKCFATTFGNEVLVRTSRWWTQARRKTEEEITRRSLGNGPAPANRITPDKIYMQGLVDLAIGVAELQEEDLPETLELDYIRINRMRTDILRTVVISAILLTAKNLMRRDVRSQWKEQAQRMWDLPLEDAHAYIGVIESRYALPPTTKTQLSGTIERILLDGQNRQLIHPVVKVILQKIRAHVYTRLSASSAEERVKAASSASQTLSSGGLPEFVEQVGALVDELQRVADVDREAHGKWYDGVIEAVGRDEAGGT